MAERRRTIRYFMRYDKEPRELVFDHGGVSLAEFKGRVQARLAPPSDDDHVPDLIVTDHFTNEEVTDGMVDNRTLDVRPRPAQYRPPSKHQVHKEEEEDPDARPCVPRSCSDTRVLPEVTEAETAPQPAIVAPRLTPRIRYLMKLAAMEAPPPYFMCEKAPHILAAPRAMTCCGAMLCAGCVGKPGATCNARRCEEKEGAGVVCGAMVDAIALWNQTHPRTQVRVTRTAEPKGKRRRRR